MTKIPVYAKLNSDNRPDKLGAYTSAEPIATEYGGTGTNNFSGTVNSLAAAQASSVTQNYIDVCSLGSGGATAFSALTDTNITSPITGQVVTWDGTDWTPSTSPAGVTVHNLLVGLSANDHPQYVLSSTNTNLSALVSNLSVVIDDLASDVTTDIGSLNAHIASSTVHFFMSSIDHGSIAGLGDNDHPQYTLSATNLALSTLVSNLQTSTSELSAYIDANEASWLAGGGATDHGTLTGLEDNDHPQYTLSSTNLNLSTLVESIETSTIDLSAYIAANEGAWSTDTNTTDHGALGGLGDDDHPQYVLVTTNTNLSSTVSNHLASSVHWDIDTLNANYINASGDSSNNAFYLSSLSATTMSATNYSGVSLSGSLADVTVGSPGSNNVLAWNGSTWTPSAISFPGGGGGLTQEQVEALILQSIASGIHTSAVALSGNGYLSSVPTTNVTFSSTSITVSTLPYPAPLIFLQLSADASSRALTEYNWLSGVTPEVINLNPDHYTYTQTGADERYVTINVPGTYAITFKGEIDSSGTSVNFYWRLKNTGSTILDLSSTVNQAADPVGRELKVIKTLGNGDTVAAFFQKGSGNFGHIRMRGSYLQIERKL